MIFRFYPMRDHQLKSIVQHQNIMRNERNERNQKSPIDNERKWRSMAYRGMSSWMHPARNRSNKWTYWSVNATKIFLSEEHSQLCCQCHPAQQRRKQDKTLVLMGFFLYKGTELASIVSIVLSIAIQTFLSVVAFCLTSISVNWLHQKWKTWTNLLAHVDALASMPTILHCYTILGKYFLSIVEHEFAQAHFWICKNLVEKNQFQPELKTIPFIITFKRTRNCFPAQILQSMQN